VVSLDLRGLEDLGGLTELDDRSVLRYHPHCITTQKVVKSKFLNRFDNFQKVVKSKFLNRFDNFQKVVKSKFLNQFNNS